MISIQDLPAFHASLNGATALLLTAGYLMIRKKRVGPHRICMVAAFVCSVLFLTSYLIYHYHVGSRPFPGQGWVRPVYYGVLISHTLLAAAVVPLVLITLSRALAGRFEKHRRIARWTLPAWLYVSITGVIVYWMLYRLYG